MSYQHVLSWLGLALLAGISLIGLRMLSYWWSFALHWRRYRQRQDITSAELRGMPVPYVKIQITTRGSAGSTEVILRGIRNVVALGAEDPHYYGQVLSVELVTESEVQARLVETTFAGAPVRVDALVLPAGYRTPRDTKLKARGLHYAVECRRRGWNRRPGRTFIVHYDEESVMVPAELRKLLAVLARTDKKLLEGPIYYPLEYTDASAICRAMEANRPVGCFECRHVMERGVPLHLHGSNLVVEEDFDGVGAGILRELTDPIDLLFGVSMAKLFPEPRYVLGSHGLTPCASRRCRRVPVRPEGTRPPLRPASSR